MKSFFPEYFIVFYCCVFFNKIYAKKNINCELQKSIANTKDKKVYLKKKKLFEETKQNPSELKPHWSNSILGSSSISNPFRSISVRRHSHIQVPTRNVQWTFMVGYLNYIYVFAKTYCFLPSIGQLTMPNFFSAKYMFAMVPTKEYSIQNSAFYLSQKL